MIHVMLFITFIQIHSGKDDFGTGGTPASLSSGDAGSRVACCSIHMKPMPTFRFGG